MVSRTLARRRPQALLPLLVLTLLGAGCVSGPGPSASDAGVVDGIDAGPENGPDAGNPAVQDAGNPASLDAGTCPTSPQTGVLPCDVAGVLTAKCQTCHSAPPTDDAPFPLVTYADTMQPFSGWDGGTVPIWQVMAKVIQPTPPDGLPHMPYGTAPQLTESELQTLADWLAACAPTGTMTECLPGDAGIRGGPPPMDAGSSSGW